MSAPKTRKELLELIRQSGLLPKKQFKTFEQECRSDDLQVILTWLVKAGFITEYQGRELFAGRNKGFFIGKYKVLRPLASGGMGMVLHCEHIHMKHQVALKLLPQDANADKHAIKRFYREARAVAAVRHPNIVKAFDVGQEGPWHCLVMEYVDGINLHKLVLKIGPLSETVAAHYMSQTATGMQEIMKSGLVHRDLKPSNLLLDREGLVKILDLGLARFTDQRADDLTRQLEYEHVLGTADFISPEQALRASDVDIRADIYALGMTFYFLLTGKLPFEGGSLATKLMAHQSRMPQPLHELIPSIDRKLEQLIVKMIQKEPKDRFQSPQELVRALAPWTVQPLPPPSPEWFQSSSIMPIRIQSPPAKGAKTPRAASEGTAPDTTIETVAKDNLSDPSTANLIAAGAGGTVISASSLTQGEEPSTAKIQPLSQTKSLSELPTITSISERLAQLDKRRPTRNERQRRQILIAIAVFIPLLGILAVILWYKVTRPKPELK
jgi:serine/threonine protein kinase